MTTYVACCAGTSTSQSGLELRDDGNEPATADGASSTPQAFAIKPVDREAVDVSSGGGVSPGAVGVCATTADHLERPPPPGEGLQAAERRRTSLIAALESLMAPCHRSLFDRRINASALTYQLPFDGNWRVLNRLLYHLMLTFTTCAAAALEPYIGSPPESLARYAAVTRVGCFIQAAAFLGSPSPLAPHIRPARSVLRRGVRASPHIIGLADGASEKPNARPRQAQPQSARSWIRMLAARNPAFCGPSGVCTSFQQVMRTFEYGWEKDWPQPAKPCNMTAAAKDALFDRLGKIERNAQTLAGAAPSAPTALLCTREGIPGAPRRARKPPLR